MAQVFHHYGAYGCPITMRFTVEDVNSGGPGDDYITAAAPFAAGDVKVSTEGAAAANITSLPTQITAGQPLYTVSLSASEMQGQQVIVSIRDQDAVEAFAPVTFIIDNNHFLLRDFAQAGGAGTITLGVFASATSDLYNEMQISLTKGTGAGQSRVITDYDGPSRVANVNRNWITNPDATTGYVIRAGADVWYQFEGSEPSGAIPDNATWAQILQYLKRRFYNKVEQTATTQTVRKDDSATALTTMTCSADSVTQVKGKSA